MDPTSARKKISSARFFKSRSQYSASSCSFEPQPNTTCKRHIGSHAHEATLTGPLERMRAATGKQILTSRRWACTLGGVAAGHGPVESLKGLVELEELVTAEQGKSGWRRGEDIIFVINCHCKTWWYFRA